MADLNLNATLEIAIEEFGKLTVEDIAKRTGAEYLAESQVLRVKYFNRWVEVSHPQGEFNCHCDISLPLVEKILILHYFSNASGLPVTKRLISFKELPGGEMYNTPFTNRSIRPFQQHFGNHPQQLRQAAEKMGGRRGDVGDVCYTIDAFPKVPVTVILWEGDDEFPPAANILFDETAPSYLPTEDYAFVASLMAAKLKETAGI